jgi:uncharacterized protein (DUF1800 family)
MKELYLFLIIILLFTIEGLAQSYIGAGNDTKITVTSSDEYQDSSWTKRALAINTVNGVGLDSEILEASRFLCQSSLGFEDQHIQDVLELGIESWIDHQMGLPPTKILPKTQEIYCTSLDSMALTDIKPTILEFRPRWWIFNYAWWDEMMRNEDLLRHRVAQAMTEIFVIARKGDLVFYGDGFASYYDMLAENAFGNYKDLLLDVTLHPCMGKYLSHLNNPKADPVNNIHPDENYAREVMQLFSIGLYELNADGSRKTINGEFIPTYGQDDIREYAKIFTGLGVSGNIPNPYNHKTVNFGKSLWTSDVTIPMKMYEEQHETGSKTLLGGQVIPAGQPGMKDIEDAIDNLYRHPNVGPFISFRLIQRLVKSNPSPEYIARVTAVFDDNGQGVRGDMGATVKAILMDSEARDCASQKQVSSSLLKSPILRYTQFARMADKCNENSYWWNDNDQFAKTVLQDLFDSPSVFNFYLPDYSPNGAIANANLYAPEFNIHNTVTSPAYVNEVYKWTSASGEIMENREGEWMNETKVQWDISRLKEFAKDPESFINEMDKLLTAGELSTFTRSEIKYVLSQIVPNKSYDYLEERVRLGTYLFLISPDYAVIR